MQRIYLDYNATTPIAPSVVEAMQPFLTRHFGNPSSNHVVGRAAHQAVEDARERVASMLGCDPDEVIFTSGGTESSNLAIKGVAFRDGLSSKGHIVISAFEHPATAVPVEFLSRMGFDVSVCRCDRDGVVDVDEVGEAIRRDTKLVSIMHANNEIGTIQPIRTIADLCKERDVIIHTDAAQSVGKITTRVEDLNVDLLSVAGHKFYAPKGIGALYVRRGVRLEPVVHGASHESGLRAGTENVPYIVALGAAAKLAERGSKDMGAQLKNLRQHLYSMLSAAIGPELTFNGHATQRLPNTLSVNFPGVSGSELLARVPEICASTGSACHSGGPATLSATLAAIDLAPEIASGTVRLSVGWQTSKDEVERSASLLVKAWEDLHR